MEESVAKEEPEVAMVNGDDQPGRRSVRRRLVQSTLFPQKSTEIETKIEQKANEGEDDNNDGDDEEEFCGSQGKKRGRKRKGKVTPQNRASKKAKGKSPMKTTPKKNGVSSLMESEDASPPPIPNLRLEAKMTAEENSRMFSGRQIHPFFASCKAGKRSQETEVRISGCLTDRSNKRITIGPIHVFERTQDDVVLDWKNWTFFEKTSVDSGCNSGGLFTSVFESCVGALSLDNFPGALHSSGAPVVQNKLSDQCILQQNNFLGTSPPIPAMPVDGQLESYQRLNSSDGDYQWDEVAILSKQADNLENSELEHQSRLLQERFVSCYYCCSIQPHNSLWTDKYQPKKATEVCGNTESVKFMSEWLQLWRERSFQASKASNNINKDSLQEDDYDCCSSDFDSENIDEEDNLKNVLLVTGPNGSGKSAAIHACAKEQGFKVLESNASDCRNGAILKQKFGEALESHCLTGSLDNPIGPMGNYVMKSAGPLSNGEAGGDFEDEVIELIPISDDEDAFDALGASGKHACNGSGTVPVQAKVKPLILFEDVDISFPEDRGFVAAVQQIAEKAKGPVILTSNSNNLVLPDNLDRLELCFTMPSPEELLHHLHMVCAAEKATIEPHLLLQLIKCCQGDIRKTIMHLQFWCQSKEYKKDRKSQKTYGLLLFDIEAGHLVLPTIIPWDFPSQLSEFVEKEIAKALSMMEENSTLMEVMEEEPGNNNTLNGLEMRHNQIDSIEAKKEVMLSRNTSIQDCNELISPYPVREFYNSFDTPVSFSRTTKRRKLDVIMSSDSEDEHSNRQSSLVSDKNVNRELFIEDCRLLSHEPNMQHCITPLTDEQLSSEAEKYDRGFQCSETANNLQPETCKTLDVSCVPESSFVPETDICNGMELSSRTVSSANVAEITEVSVSCELPEDLLPVEPNDPGKSMHKLVKTSDRLGSTCNIAAEASHEEVAENSQIEYDEAVSRGHAVMDECSRMDFNKRSFSMAKFKDHVATDLVQESWKRLRENRANLSHYIDSEQKDALKILKLTSRMSDLISQTDQLLSDCQIQDSFELLRTPSENSDAFSWCAEHLQMVDAVSQHGFCLYAKDIDAIGSKLGFEHRVDLSQEMLALSTNTMALGKLLGEDAGASRTSVDGKVLDKSPSKCELPVKRDAKSCLFNIIESIVPSRSYLALKGAFHEYTSTLGCISRSEASRLSKGMNLTKRRRTRGARHYLSTGAMMLSPEDISLLDQYNFSGKLLTADASFNRS